MTSDKPNISTLHDLLDYDARKFYSAETQLNDILPEWIRTARSIQLKNVLQKYMDFVHQHRDKLLNFIVEENINSLSTPNGVMQAFLSETAEKMSNCADTEVKDACLLASVQSINHYKISMYGTAAAFAKALGNDESARVFHEVEVSEKHIDDRLSQLAEHEINANAVAPIVLPGSS